MSRRPHWLHSYFRSSFIRGTPGPTRTGITDLEDLRPYPLDDGGMKKSRRKSWYSHEESNPDLLFRKEVSSPLNDGSNGRGSGGAGDRWLKESSYLSGDYSDTPVIV